MNFRTNEITALLGRMGFQPSVAAPDTLEVEIPPFRVDILHEVDLVEDAIIAYGLNRMNPEVPKVMTLGKLLPDTRLRNRVRDLMVGSGFQEIATYVLSSREVMESKPLIPVHQLVEIAKPFSSEYTVLRDALLPKLLQFLGCNAHIAYPQKIFEYDQVVRNAGGHPINVPFLAAAISDHKVSFEEIQAVAAALFSNISREVQFKPSTSPAFIEGRTARVIVGGKDIGIIGEVAPQALINFGISCPVLAMEFDMSRL